MASLLGAASATALASGMGAWPALPLAWSVGALGWRLWQAGARPELGIWGAAVVRGRHPGRVAVTVRGVPPPEWVGVLAGATCFVGSDEEDTRVRALGYEPAAWGRARPGHRWRRAWWVPPGSAGPGLSWVGATVRLRGPADELRGQALAVVGTDIVDLPLVPVEVLAAVVEEWAERGIEVGSLAAAMAPEP